MREKRVIGERGEERTEYVRVVREARICEMREERVSERRDVTLVAYIY